MKSLVEEASSITKAIEKAWIRAGQPQSFSVKIFETPEVGFLGFTRKSAKVGIFFEEPVIEKSQKSNNRSNKRFNRKPSEQNARRKETSEDNREPRERGPRDNRRRNDRRENNNPEETNNTNHPRRPQKRLPRREDLRQDKRPQRDRSEKPGPNKAETKPAAQKITPVSKPQETAPAPAVKRPPKFSGRRFSGHKKDSDNS